MAADRLKAGRVKENDCGRAMADNGIVQCYWQPPRAKYAGVGYACTASQDVFGVFDFVGVDANGCVVGVQVCRKRPGEVGVRKAKVLGFCNRYHPALRAIVAHYDRAGFCLEELTPDMIWRIIAMLPHPKGVKHESKEVQREPDIQAAV